MLEAWYERLDADELTARFGTRLDADGHELFERTFAKGRRKDSARAARKLTVMVDGEPRFTSAPPLLTPLRELHGADADSQAAYVRELLDQYTGGLHADVEHLFAATDSPIRPARSSGSAASAPAPGSFSSSPGAAASRWCCRPRRRRASVLEPHLGPSEYENHGERVVRGQRMMQAASDILLSWQRSTGLDGLEHDFYVRQLWDWKASADLSSRG
jgi:Uncharacterized protein conserved in bacteria (DUF2252)